LLDLRPFSSCLLKRSTNLLQISYRVIIVALSNQQLSELRPKIEWARKDAESKEISVADVRGGSHSRESDLSVNVYIHTLYQ
jgi:hypothetical protein